MNEPKKVTIVDFSGLLAAANPDWSLYAISDVEITTDNVKFVGCTATHWTGRTWRVEIKGETYHLDIGGWTKVQKGETNL